MPLLILQGGRRFHQPQLPVMAPPLSAVVEFSKPGTRIAHSALKGSYGETSKPLCNVDKPRRLMSFGGIPNSRNVLFLQIFQKRAAKPSAGNTSAGFRSKMAANPVEPDLALHESLSTKASQTFSGTFSGTMLNLTWLCTKASPNLPRNLLRKPVESNLALHQSLPHLLQNLLRNFVEPDLALHQSLPDLLWNPIEPDLALHQSLRNLLRNLLRNPVGLELALHQSLPDLLPAEPDLALHQSLPDLLPVEPDLALPKPPRIFSGTFFRTLLNLTWLCTKASQTFSGTFSGTLLNLTWLCTKASQTFTGTFSGTLLNLTWLCTEVWTWAGACTSAHRSYSGLKTPLAYAVGEIY